MIARACRRLLCSRCRVDEWTEWHAKTREHIQKAKAGQGAFELTDPTEIKYYQWIADEIVSATGPLGGSVLEIGCGSGALSMELNKRYGSRITMLDSSETALEYARVITGDRAVQYIVADARQIPLRDESFDFVHSVGLIEHYSDHLVVEMIREMRRVTKNGGHVFIGIPNFFSPNLISLWLRHGKGSERFLSIRRLVSLAINGGLTVGRSGHSEFAFSKSTNYIVPEVVERFLGRHGMGFLNYVVCER